MLAPREIPAKYQAWNARWGAPWGKPLSRCSLFRSVRPRRAFPRLVGPFALQPNNTTRVFEYPWAFFAVALPSRASVVDLGGSSGGFQFVLAKQGAHVINVDPGEDARGYGWPVDASTIPRPHPAVQTDVEPREITLQDAQTPH